MELGSQQRVPAPLPQHRQGHPVGTQHAWASLVEGVPITGRSTTHIPPPPASYLEADDVRDLHAVQIALDLGNAAASCHGLRGAGRV